MEDQLFNDEMLLGIRTGAKLIEVKKTNGLVKLNKEFLGIELGFLNKKELELLYILCLAFKERQVQSIKIHIREIKELMSSGEKEVRKTDIENYVETLHKRLAKVNIRTDKSGISGTLNLFEYVITDTRDFETGIVTIIAKITDTAMNFFNNLEGKKKKYLRFLIEDAIKLKGKYSTLLLPHLISCSKTKEFEITTENLEEILGIKGKYSRKTDFNKRVLKPLLEELEIIFKDLKVKALKKNELDPRKITHYLFSWSNNINYDDKKEETSFFYYEIEETNNNDKKEYSKIFTGTDNIDKTEEIEVAEIKEVADETEEELTEEEEIKKFIKENIPTLNYKSIQETIKNRLESGETKEEIISFIKRNWHRAIENDNYKNKVAILIKAIKEKFELNLTKEEIQKEKNILNQKGIFKKEVKFIKSDWGDSPKKEVTVTEDVKEIENIDYKKYLYIKKEKLSPFDTTKKDEIYLMAQEVAFRNSFTKKYTVTLTKKEYEQEIKDLAEIFYKNNTKEVTKLYKNFFIIKKEEVKEEVAVADIKEVKEEVTVADVKEVEEKANFKIISIQEIEEEEKKHKEYLQWLDDVNNLPSSVKLSEIYYNLYTLNRDRNDFIDKFGKENKETIAEFDKEIAELEEKRKELELKQEEEKKELLNKKYSNNAKEKRNNIKSLKDFTIKEVTVADVKEKEIAVAEVKVDVKKEVVVEEREEEELDLDNIVTNLFKK